MPLKAVVSTILGLLGSLGDTNIGDLLIDLQIVIIKQLKEIIDQINIGQEAFKNKLNSIGTKKVKYNDIKRGNLKLTPTID